jgi:hypothetical protein
MLSAVMLNVVRLSVVVPPSDVCCSLRRLILKYQNLPLFETFDFKYFSRVR